MKVYRKDVNLGIGIKVEPKFYKKIKKLKKAFKSCTTNRERKILYVSATAGYFNNLNRITREHLVILPYLAKQRRKIVMN